MPLPRISLDGVSLGWLTDAIGRAADLKGGGLVRARKGPSGTVLAVDPDRSMDVKLSGGGNPYTGTPVYATASGTWASYGDGTYAGVYEDNGVAGLDGKVVRVRPTPDAEWRFTYRRQGAAPSCTHTFRVLDGGSPVAGAVITLTTVGGTPVGTCTTGADGTCEIAIPAATAQYTATVSMPAGHAAVPPYTFWGGCEVAAGCPCSGGAAGTTPAELSMKVANASTLADGPDFESCELVYQDTPAWASVFSLGPKNHYSDQLTYAGAINSYRYVIRCESGLYVVRKIYQVHLGSSTPYISTALKKWAIGISGNRCQDGTTTGAFHLDAGLLYTGSNPATTVVVDSFGAP